VTLIVSDTEARQRFGFYISLLCQKHRASRSPAPISFKTGQKKNASWAWHIVLMFAVRLAQPTTTDAAGQGTGTQDPARVLCWQSRNWVPAPLAAQAEQRSFQQQPGFSWFLLFSRD